MSLYWLFTLYRHTHKLHVTIRNKEFTVAYTRVFLCLCHSVVFMGSEKYPAENGFDAFLKKHGGSDNASTDLERTIFQFDVQRKYFKEALDRQVSLNYSQTDEAVTRYICNYHVQLICRLPKYTIQSHNAKRRIYFPQICFYRWIITTWLIICKLKPTMNAYIWVNKLFIWVVMHWCEKPSVSRIKL